MMYLILEGGVGDDLLWWKPGGYGYTTNVDAAGRFNRAAALTIISNRDRQDFAIPEEEVLRTRLKVVPRSELEHLKLHALGRSDEQRAGFAQSCVTTNEPGARNTYAAAAPAAAVDWPAEARKAAIAFHAQEIQREGLEGVHVDDIAVMACEHAEALIAEMKRRPKLGGG